MEEVVNRFLDYLTRQKRFSSLTASGYSTDLRQFSNFLSESYPSLGTTDVTSTVIRAFIAHMMEQGYYSTSVGRKLSSLKSFFKYLLKTGVVSVNPAKNIRAPKKPRRLASFITEEETGRIFSGMHFENDFVGIRNRLIIDLLYQTGMRRAELIGLLEGQVDLHGLSLRVTGKRNKERVIPFGLPLKRALDNYLTAKNKSGLYDQHLLVSEKDKALRPDQVNNIVAEALAGVTTSSKKSPHVLRHSFATHMLNNGADINAVKELLGHSSLAATQVYTHNNIEKLKKSYNQAHPRSGQ
jgi:integrase/recombinase XerC